MKSANKQQNAVRNVQNSQTPNKSALMVLHTVEDSKEVTPEPENVIQIEPEKMEEVKAKAESFATSAEDRIKRAANFSILSGKFTHLKMKSEEIEKFIISSDGTKEKLVLKNSAGLEIEVTNSQVLSKVVNLMQDTVKDLLNATEQEVKSFVI